MFRNDSIAGSWRDLLARLEDRGALAVWAGEDDRLAGVGDVEADLLPLLARGADPARADDLWAALIRQAARDGGDDLDAVMLLVHLSSDWVLAMGRQLRDLAPDIAGVLVQRTRVPRSDLPLADSRRFGGGQPAPGYPPRGAGRVPSLRA